MSLDGTTKSPHTGSTIFEAVKQCVKQIEVYTSSDRPQSRRYATSVQEKLEVWARYSGATSRQGLSLDDRLSALPGIKIAVLGLLLMITAKVKQALELPDEEIGISDDGSWTGRNEHGTREPQTLSEGSNVQSDSNHEVAHQSTLWAAITKAIDSLFKLTAAIRDSDNSSGDTETPAHYSRPDDSYFEEMAKLFVRRWFPYARRDLCDQLGHAIYIRRRKILYQQKHEEKLQFQRSSMAPDSAAAQTKALSGQFSATLGIATGRQFEQSKAAKENYRLIAPSLTQFSQFQTQSVIMRRARAATVVTGRTKGSLVLEDTKLGYPDPPTSLNHHDVLFCPYCCKQLTLSQLHNWTLKPFVCMSESCQNPPRLFAFQSDWLQHMFEYHGKNWHQTVHMTTWFCDINHEEQQEFVSVDEFREHLTFHELSVPNQNVLIRHNQALGLRASGVCPLCEEAPPQKADMGVRALFDHIANHLRRIALIALPAADVSSTLEDSNKGSIQSGIAMPPESSGSLPSYMSKSDFDLPTWDVLAPSSPETITVAPKIIKEEEENFTIKCVCDYWDDDGFTILCESCDTWQHTECYYQPKNIPGDDDSHSCLDCDPRTLDVQRAIAIQRAKREPMDTKDRRNKKPARSIKKKVKPIDRGTSSGEQELEKPVYSDETTAYLYTSLSDIRVPKNLLYEKIMIPFRSLKGLPHADILENLSDSLRLLQVLARTREGVSDSSLRDLVARRKIVVEGMKDW